MTNTLFIRLLQHEDKGAALVERIGALREGRADCDVYAVDPESFRQVSNTPFCYWVSERIRRLFTELPPFEGDGRTVKVGLQTGDDFRFVRAWWEVPAERILDGGQWAVRSGQKGQEEKWTEERVREFQAWCRRRTYEGKRWAPFAKGGEYSPYYADVHLVVNWEKEGAEMKAFSGSVIRNPDHYFRPGLTYACRVRRFSTAVVPVGCIFSHVAQMMFLNDTSQLTGICAFYSSIGIRFLLSLLTITRKYEVGLIKTLPYVRSEEMKSTGMNHIVEFQKRSLISETSRLGTSIFNSKSNSTLQAVADDIDKESLRLLGLSADEERVRSLVHTFEQLSVSSDDLSTESNETNGTDECTSEDGPSNPWHGILSFIIGVLIGRWDVRIAIDPSLAPKLPDPFDPLPVCPPGMLVGPDGLPAEPGRIVSEEWLRARPDANTLPPDGSVKNPTIPDSEYPLRISWDGVLVDDPEHPGDIVRRVREVLEVLWKDRAEAIEKEACGILGVRELRDYFRKPGNGGFWMDHVKRYSKSRRKAPIYWYLRSAKGNYGLWLYYHRLDKDILFKAMLNYVEPKIRQVSMQYAEGSRQLERAKENRSETREIRRLEKEMDRLDGLLSELRDFEEKLRRAANLHLDFDLNDGVILNMAPLWELVPWSEPKKYWEELQKGKYDWAHISLQLWPDRVKEKCRTDRSIAIAHGLEHLYKVSNSKPGGSAATAEESEDLEEE